MSEHQSREIELKQFECLSEDRRQAAQIFAQGILIGIAIMGAGFTFMLDAETATELNLLGVLGVGVLLYLVSSAWRCKQHNTVIHGQLAELTNSLQMRPVISTALSSTSCSCSGFSCLCVG